MNLNKVILIGRISQQPNINQSKSGFSYTRFNIAISRDYQGNNKEKDSTDFIPLVAFGNTSIYVNRFFNKGDLISVVGSIQTMQYKNKNGDLTNSFSILVDQIKSLEPISVTQSRAERANNFSQQDGVNTKINQSNYEHNEHNNAEPTFESEESDDKPWELDL